VVVANNFRVDITGAAELANRLRRFDADMYKVLQKELKLAGELVAEDARGRVPDSGLSGWGSWLMTRTSGSNGQRGSVKMVQATTSRSLSFDSAAIKSGIKSKVSSRTRQGNKTSLRVVVEQGNAAGSIYEIAGIKHPDSVFNANLIGKRGGGKVSRTLSEALYLKGNAAGNAIEAAVQAAMDRVNNGD